MFNMIISSNTGAMLTRTEKLAKPSAVTVSSTSSVSCCTKCPGATVDNTNKFANNSIGFKWNGNGNQQGHLQMPINLLSPNQAMLAMHRKCKSKSKSKIKKTLGSGPPVSVVSSSAPYSTSSALRQISHHLDTFPTVNIIQSKPSTHQKLIHSTTSSTVRAISRVMLSENYENITRSNQVLAGKTKKKMSSSSLCKMLRCPLPTLGATSFVTLLTVICIETVLLSNMSSCAKTFYMHWNTSNSIFRIDNTDHIIDVNKGNLAFEFDQVHIICPVYEPGAFDNETEKYIIYNVSKVEYETCRITNADPRVIAICDKPQKLMFFTITFRPFTPQPGGLEFLPGNDYYFISTSSKDDLYRRIGGRCSTNNMKVVFKVCCAAEEKNRTTPESTLVGSVSGERDNSGSTGNRMENAGVDLDINSNVNVNVNAHGHGYNSVNTIGISGVNTGFVPAGSGGASSGNKAGQLMPINGMGTSINTNIDQFNRIPLQPNIVSNNVGAAGSGIGNGNSPGSSGGIILSPGHGSINMLPPGRGSVGIHIPYPGHHHIQTGIRINNVPTQQNNNPHPHYKGSGNANNNNNNGKDILKNQSEESHYYLHEVGKDNGNAILNNIGRYLPPVVDTNHSNIVQSTINWLLPAWGSGSGADINTSSSKTNITSNSLDNSTTRINNNYTPRTFHSPPDNGNEIKKNEHHNYDKHPNEVVKNEELTYNSGSSQSARSHFNTYVWILIWLGSMYGIEPTVWIALGVVNTIHNALGICATGTYRTLERRHAA